jgi:hypothetical protein
MGTKKVYAMIGFLLMLQPVSASNHFRILDYDDVREEGGFKSLTLGNVSEIIPAGKVLTSEEMEDLISDTGALSNLRVLDLEGQGVDDNFIISLCNNKTLKRIIKLNLSKNEKITNKSVESILESEILGSVRDLPQISGRYGIPSSVIYMKAKETGVTPLKKGYNYFDEHRFGFNIAYIHPIKNSKTSDPVEDGVKFIEVTLD